MNQSDEVLDAMYRVGERKLEGLRRTKSYKAALSIAAGACGGSGITKYDATKRYSREVELSVFSTGLGNKTIKV